MKMGTFTVMESVANKYFGRLMDDNFIGLELYCELPCKDIENIHELCIVGYRGITDTGFTEIKEEEIWVDGKPVDDIISSLYDNGGFIYE